MAFCLSASQPVCLTARGPQSRRRHVVARVGAGFPPGNMGGGMGGGMGGPGQGEIVQNDPENLYKAMPLASGIIQRRMMQKRIEEDKDFAKAMAAASDELKKEALVRRETRRPPANHEEMVEYFLNTLAEDLEYEVARYRPRITPDFFLYLDNVLGTERFSEAPDQDKIAELELLRRYLTEATEALDKCVAATSSAKDRMMKLLTAKDKKEMIVEMAGNNEIDQALMDLLSQNIEMAKNAGQEEPAKFMEKVKQACSRYLITTPASAPAAMPAVPDQLAARPAASGIPILTAPASAPAATPAAAGPAAKPGSTIINPKDPSGLKSAGKLII